MESLLTIMGYKRRGASGKPRKGGGGGGGGLEQRLGPRRWSASTHGGASDYKPGAHVNGMVKRRVPFKKIRRQPIYIVTSTATQPA